MITTFDYELDARALTCPLPVLRAKHTIDRLQRGQILCVRATDPGSVRDFEAFCRQTGNEQVSFEERSGEYIFCLRKN
ncbi:MAG: response regulator SirA [Proteobacteria bacterium]|jgi:tRNA 2-thiouridine synthesizing protein A|nr:response regulator SirA [Pseudomonadota bacterium]